MWALRRDRLSKRRLALALGFVVALGGFSVVYSARRLRHLRLKEGPSVALVQPASKRSVETSFLPRSTSER